MNLTTNYLGIQLSSPFVTGAGPLGDSMDMCKHLEDAGAAAISLRSLFEEQLHSEGISTFYSTDAHANSSAEALSYFADPDDFVIGPQEYFEHIGRLKQHIDIPVFGSLNGFTPGGWTQYAADIEQAGADGLELNFYFVPIDPGNTGFDIEERLVDIVRSVKATVSIPIVVKLSPFFTSLPNVVRQLEQAGTDGLILFNRFYNADIDIDALEIKPHLQLSKPHELLLRLRWLSILSGNFPLLSFAVSGGVHSAPDAIKSIMAGASVVQLVSSLLTHGPSFLSQIKQDVAEWMEEQEYESLRQMQGSMNLQRCPDPRLLTRANYMHVLQTWSSV